MTKIRVGHRDAALRDKEALQVIITMHDDIAALAAVIVIDSVCMSGGMHVLHKQHP